MSNEPLWERSFPKCTVCGSKNKLSKVIYDEMEKQGSKLNTLAAGYIPFNMMTPVEIVPLETVQLVMPIKVLARFYDECADCGHVDVTRVSVGLAMGMPGQKQK